MFYCFRKDFNQDQFQNVFKLIFKISKKLGNPSNAILYFSSLCSSPPPPSFFRFSLKKIILQIFVSNLWKSRQSWKLRCVSLLLLPPLNLFFFSIFSLFSHHIIFSKKSTLIIWDESQLFFFSTTLNVFLFTRSKVIN